MLEGTDVPREKEVDTVVKMKGSTHVGPFQTEILEGKISQAPMCMTHMLWWHPLGVHGGGAGQGMPATP